ncbi:hypothetical protein KHO57_gp199 [Mycobacterium phage Phabba]|uniref:Uncharacterized protein n=1 Tax=Mycobacterium phage Phabba TaxID=2027899 RepID=A0A249XSI5_9CAUD|nr:hypothetical protein KHO57_gp199 [Mycobacterium phage Phabba]ASZ74705.1 hypothetical protein SEA_PHABBA_136 [Mycobacterium phage Phabba]
MSHLYITDYKGREFKMNVTQFRSPMQAQINSVQTRTMLAHFPIRSGQPDINFTVQYADLNDKHAFEGFVREHHVSTREDDNTEVNLWWPERNIVNWTGHIMGYSVTEKRFETAPSATFGVQLVKSLMSEKTTLASRGADWRKILGPQLNQYRGYDDLILVLPNFTGQQPVNPQDTTLEPPGPPAPQSPIAPPAVGR